MKYAEKLRKGRTRILYALPHLRISVTIVVFFTMGIFVFVSILICADVSFTSSVALFLSLQSRVILSRYFLERSRKSQYRNGSGISSSTSQPNLTTIFI